MHCVGGKCILKYHASFESFSSENAKSLFGPSFRLVLLFALIQLLRRVSPVIFDIFHASTFPICEGVWARQTTGC